MHARTHTHARTHGEDCCFSLVSLAKYSLSQRKSKPLGGGTLGRPSGSRQAEGGNIPGPSGNTLGHPSGSRQAEGGIIPGPSVASNAGSGSLDSTRRNQLTTMPTNPPTTTTTTNHMTMTTTKHITTMTNHTTSHNNRTTPQRHAPHHASLRHTAPPPTTTTTQPFRLPDLRLLPLLFPTTSHTAETGTDPGSADTTTAAVKWIKLAIYDTSTKASRTKPTYLPYEENYFRGTDQHWLTNSSVGSTVGPLLPPPGVPATRGDPSWKPALPGGPKLAERRASGPRAKPDFGEPWENGSGTAPHPTGAQGTGGARQNEASSNLRWSGSPLNRAIATKRLNAPTPHPTHRTHPRFLPPSRAGKTLANFFAGATLAPTTVGCDRPWGLPWLLRKDGKRNV